MADLAVTAFVSRLDKTGSAVWTALDGENRAAFEDEFRTALAEVAETFDVDRLSQVMRRWWPRAVLDAHPDPIAEHIGQRLADGDESVLTKTGDELRAEIRSPCSELGKGTPPMSIRRTVPDVPKSMVAVARGPAPSVATTVPGPYYTRSRTSTTVARAAPAGIRP